nr:IclR family transcriptional regulator [Microbacterium immunditiarum]
MTLRGTRPARRIDLLVPDVTPKQPRQPILDSADNVLRILLILRRDGVVRVSDVATELGVALSTAHRLLSTLRHRGFVVQGDKREYVPGPALGSVSRAGGRARIITAAHESLERLSASLGETVNLMMLMTTNPAAITGAGVQVVDCVESTAELHVVSRLGLVVPARGSAGGRAILAEMALKDVDRLHSALGSQSPEMIRLGAELDATRARGFALSVAENDPDLVSFAMSVRGRGGEVVGAVSVMMPIDRYRPALLGGSVAELRAATAAITEVLE